MMKYRCIISLLLGLCSVVSVQAQTESQQLLPEQLPFELGVAQIPDRETFEKLSYQGKVNRDDYLSGIEFIKFVVEIVPPKIERIYWINTNNIQAHPRFMNQIGIAGAPGGGRGDRGPRPERGEREGRERMNREGGGEDSRAQRGMFEGQFGGEFDRGMPPMRGRMPQSPLDPNAPLAMRGAISYLPEVMAPDGTKGLYIFDFQPHDSFSFDKILIAYEQVIKTMPFVEGKLAYNLFEQASVVYETERDLYDQSAITVYRDGDLFGHIPFLALNEATSFGRLRFLTEDTLPGVRDIVIARVLPNEMPRVAGVITAARQTPLSHVNLRAVQDKIPNAYVANILESQDVKALMGKFVRLDVSSQDYSLREASLAEVEQYFADLRPSEAPSLPRDLSKIEILPLHKIDFDSATSVGVKAANLAVLKNIGLPAGTVPDGFAVPFYFYDQYMQHNDFYTEVEQLLTDDILRNDRHKMEQALEDLRKRIEEGEMPEWMMSSLATVQNAFPEGSALRCRSSTNNEDLPGFSGAGLYDSFTHNPDEGHLSKSVKQVYASLWNFRAFEEREFHRIDHRQVAMGILVHPNFSDELANGVAVTDDVLYGSKGNFYVNTQRGENLVTNPDERSSPEELLLANQAVDGFSIIQPAADNLAILTDEHINALRSYLAIIQRHFSEKYGVEDNEPFAMEIEFKVTVDNRLVIKQARPWVYN